MKLAKICLLLLAGALAFGTGPAWGQAKVAVVDIQKCVQLTEQGKAAYRELKREVDKIQDELSSKEKEIEEIRSKLEKGGSVLSESTKLSLEGELGRKSRSYRDLYEDSQARIRQLEVDRTRPIFNRVVGLVKEMGQAKGLDFVLDARAGLVYFSSTLDITSEVIEEYNKKYPIGGSGAKSKTTQEKAQ
ncbi:MAG: OmpH family outer membrane protein [Deltaproteobacteria bacterium]|nr:OmpH family outer membrane protein [Deltaproteobacteria bacterium]